MTALLWALGVIVAVALGVIAYMILRRSQSPVPDPPLPLDPIGNPWHGEPWEQNLDGTNDQ